VTRTRLYRPEVYRFLPLLVDQELVHSIPLGKRHVFIAESPKKIYELFTRLKENATHVIHDLEEKYATMDRKPDIHYQEGKKGITAVFSDIVDTLEPEETFYRVTSETDVDHVNTYLPASYREKRDAKNLQRYVIMSANAAKGKQKRLDRDLVVVPKNMDDFQDDILMTIYGDKVAYIDFTTETSITITNPLIAEFQKKLFKIAYNALKKNS